MVFNDSSGPHNWLQLFQFSNRDCNLGVTNWNTVIGLVTCRRSDGFLERGPFRKVNKIYHLTRSLLIFSHLSLLPRPRSVFCYGQFTGWPRARCETRPRQRPWHSCKNKNVPGPETYRPNDFTFNLLLVFGFVSFSGPSTTVAYSVLPKFCSLSSLTTLWLVSSRTGEVSPTDVEWRVFYLGLETSKSF